MRGTQWLLLSPYHLSHDVQFQFIIVGELYLCLEWVREGLWGTRDLINRLQKIQWKMPDQNWRDRTPSVQTAWACSSLPPHPGIVATLWEQGPSWAAVTTKEGGEAALRHVNTNWWCFKSLLKMKNWCFRLLELKFTFTGFTLSKLEGMLISSGCHNKIPDFGA